MFIFLLLLGFASAQYPEWSTISWNGKTANIMRAVGPNSEMNGAIDCTQYFLGECEITLNITHMLTMTLYDYDPKDLTKSGGHRRVNGYAININADGSFAFRYAVPMANRKISTFLWPIIADAHMKNDTLGRRSVIAVNNQVPGPTIIAKKGQILNIKVVNNLASESISIHWHGQHVNGTPATPWMDGVAHITQCPILPYTEFTYRFEPDLEGTHWYHAHSGAQRTDGLFGALIIKSDNEFDETDLESITKMDTYKDCPEEHTISLTDWQHDNSIDLFTVIHSSSSFQNPINESEMYNNTKIYDGSESAPYPFLSGLINGLGWEFTPVNDQSCTHSKKNPLNFFNVDPGNVYRFRLIGAQNTYAFRFSIEDHALKLIATDGKLVKTTREVDYIIIHSGERYDFLLDTTGKSSGDYWIVAETLETKEDLDKKKYFCAQGRKAYAILHYSDYDSLPWPLEITHKITSSSRCTESSICYAVNCPFQEFPEKYNIKCLNVGSFEQRQKEPKKMLKIGDNEKSLFLNFGFGGDVSGSSINGRQFHFPPNPPTTQYSDLPEDFVAKNGKKACTYSQELNMYEGEERRCLHVYKIKDKIVQNKGTVEMVFMNLLNRIDDGQAHPVHLHGHHFQVIHIGYPTEECIKNNGPCHHPDIVCPESHCDANVNWRNYETHFEDGIQEPIEKDTVIVPVGGYVVIRFRADNPGWWFLHCHIEPHQLEGMSMVVREGTPPPPPDSFPKCGNFEIAKPKPGSSTRQVVELTVLIPLLLVWYAL